MVKTEQSANTVLIVSWTMSSVVLSVLDVASSKNCETYRISLVSIQQLLRTATAAASRTPRQYSCRAKYSRRLAHQNTGIAEDCARKAQELPFSDAQVASALLDRSVQALASPELLDGRQHRHLMI